MYIVKSEVTEESLSWGNTTWDTYSRNFGIAKTREEAEAYIKKLQEDKYYKRHTFEIETIEWLKDLND